VASVFEPPFSVTDKNYRRITTAEIKSGPQNAICNAPCRRSFVQFLNILCSLTQSYYVIVCVSVNRKFIGLVRYCEASIAMCR